MIMWRQHTDAGKLLGTYRYLTVGRIVVELR